MDQSRCISSLNKLSHNLQEDVAFAFAYLDTDLTSLKSKSRKQKQQFLDEVRELVIKYSKEKPDIELFH